MLEFLKALPGEVYIFLASLMPFVELRGAIPIGAALGVEPITNFLISLVGNMLPVPFILLFVPKIIDFLSRFALFRPLTDWLGRTARKHSERVLKKETEAASGQKNTTLAAELTLKSQESSTLTEESSIIDDKNSTFYGKMADSVVENATLAEKSAKNGCENTTPIKKSGKGRAMTGAIFLALMLFVALPVPGTGAWCASLVASLFSLPERHSLLAILLGVIICATIMTLASYGVVGFLSFLA